jgi:hypothetical protein
MTGIPVAVPFLPVMAVLAEMPGVSGLFKINSAPTFKYLWCFNRRNNYVLWYSPCLAVKNIGKPCAGKPHARFDEGRQG